MLSSRSFNEVAAGKDVEALKHMPLYKLAFYITLHCIFHDTLSGWLQSQMGTNEIPAIWSEFYCVL